MNFLDKDGDNRISLEEAKKARKQTFADNFDTLDKNQDGYIDIEEIKLLKNINNANQGLKY